MKFLIILSLLLVNCFSFAMSQTEYDIYYKKLGPSSKKGVSVDGQVFTSISEGSRKIIIRNVGSKQLDLSSGGFEDTYLKMNYRASDSLRAAIIGRFYSIYDPYNKEFDSSFNFQRFISDAYIVVEKVANKNVAIVIGKHSMAYGQKIAQLPNNNKNITDSISELDEVIGLSVILNSDDMKIIDSAAVSVFEGGHGDLEVDDFDGIALRVSKTITDKIALSMSYAQYGYDDFDTGASRTSKNASIGILYAHNSWKFWSELFYLDENQVYGQADYAATIGVSKDIAKRHKVSGSYEYINNEAVQYNLGYEFKYTDQAYFGTELRYRDQDDDVSNRIVSIKDDLSANLTFKYLFQLK